MPRVAALLDVMQISDIIKVVDDETFQRPIYAGNALSTVKSNDKIKIITVRSTAFEASENTGGSAEIKSINGSGDTDLSKFIKSELSSSERPELTSAKIVISGGRGMQDGSNFGMLEKVADKLGQLLVHQEPLSMLASFQMTIKLVKQAKWLHQIYTLLLVFPAQFSTLLV